MCQRFPPQILTQIRRDPDPRPDPHLLTKNLRKSSKHTNVAVRRHRVGLSPSLALLDPFAVHMQKESPQNSKTTKNDARNRMTLLPHLWGDYYLNPFPPPGNGVGPVRRRRDRRGAVEGAPVGP